MIISHARKFVLFSPWKTASSTCNDRLERYNESTYSKFFYFNKHLNRVTHQHITISEFKALPESKLGYTTASFVRNPYDRAYSGFIQLQRDIAYQPLAEYPHAWIRELVKAQLSENQKRIADSDYDFNRWIMLLPEYEIMDVGRNTNMPLHPASYWTHFEGKPYVNFIGKVERFEQDFEIFCQRADLDTPPMINRNVTNLTSSDKNGYRYTGIMSKRAICRINEVFKTDFDLLGYEMIM
ncbi:sulfotransferase family 2 domain-containing protein [Mesorhizobium sp. Cs1299R1N3]|uniref:sulfotransferase family 2 domain-containing protein n=1 Tax=Mesorhizobium sp. Cs1299R1N3 TaxID=3015173 RepID=UPI00301D9F08